jgi:hypothetical protein
MTEAEEAEAAQYRKLDAIRKYLNDNSLTPKEAFERLEQMLKNS